MNLNKILKLEWIPGLIAALKELLSPETGRPVPVRVPANTGSANRPGK